LRAGHLQIIAIKALLTTQYIHADFQDVAFCTLLLKRTNTYLVGNQQLKPQAKNFVVPSRTAMYAWVVEAIFPGPHEQVW